MLGLGLGLAEYKEERKKKGRKKKGRKKQKERRKKEERKKGRKKETSEEGHQQYMLAAHIEGAKGRSGVYVGIKRPTGSPGNASRIFAKLLCKA